MECASRASGNAGSGAPPTPIEGAGIRCGNENIAGSFRETKIRGEKDGNNSSNATPVECIWLDDHHRMPKARFRGDGIGEFCPPHRASLHHHSSGGNDLISTLMMFESSVDSSPPSIASRRSFPCWLPG